MKDVRVEWLEMLYLTGDLDVRMMIRAIIDKERCGLGDLAPETLDDLVEMCDMLLAQLPDAVDDRMPGAPRMPSPFDADPNPA